ncbi:MAG TPA: 2,3-bisphosphoglycerate-independent phosphoglycerate mutase [Herpetosiphonaceae bacterium]
MSNRQPVALIILDGWGIAPPGPGNGVALADTPNVDGWALASPFTQLNASGLDVGLPPGQIGNSEVGHLNIGAGLIVNQDSTRISLAISDGAFFANQAFAQALAHVKANGSRLHLIGLAGSGGVHAYDTHLAALLKLAADHGLSEVYVHAFMDGRDTLPQSGLAFMQSLEASAAAAGAGKVASVIGRYFAMDRDKRWERIGLAYDALVAGVGRQAPSASAAILESYARDPRGDEFIEPTVILGPDGVPLPRIADGDAVICFNFRADRVRQITRAFTQPDLNEMIVQWYGQQQAQGLAVPDTIWQRQEQLRDLVYVTMTQYDASFALPVAFPPHYITAPLASVVAAAGLRQYHSAETEKYAHVTFFMNGGREEPYPGEDRALVPSPKVATYDLQPEMSAAGVAGKLLEAIESEQYDLFIVNFANPDMVGHTGVIPAVVKACETVDRWMGEIMPALHAKGGVAVLIADHGNAEQMIDPETGGPHTAHTTNPVPCILVAPPGAGLDTASVALRPGGRLADVAPTVLDLLGLAKAPEMTGESLLVRLPKE